MEVRQRDVDAPFLLICSYKKNEPTFADSFYLVAGGGLEPPTFGL